MLTATYTYSMKVGLARHGKETLHYGSSLEDTTSSYYQQLSEAAREGLDRMVMQSDLRDIYHGVVVNGFQPAHQGDGVTVNFYVQVCKLLKPDICHNTCTFILHHISPSKFHHRAHLCKFAS
jgi:hypothetical protein